MPINNYLDAIASNLISRNDEKDAIDNSVEVFKNRIRDFFTKNNFYNLQDIKVYGSYERNTNLPQLADVDTDVDIMLVMNNDGSMPQTYLNRVRSAVEAKYSRSDIKQATPTIILQMQHIKLEITPAILKAGRYLIKRGDNGWLCTSCLTDFDNLAKANQNNYNMVKPLIRLLKYWNVSKNNKAFSSYQIEKEIVHYYLECRNQRYNTKLYLLCGFIQLRKLSMTNNQMDFLNKTINRVKTAIKKEKLGLSLSALDDMQVVIDRLD